MSVAVFVWTKVLYCWLWITVPFLFSIYDNDFLLFGMHLYDFNYLDCIFTINIGCFSSVNCLKLVFWSVCMRMEYRTVWSTFLVCIVEPTHLSSFWFHFLELWEEHSRPRCSKTLVVSISVSWACLAVCKKEHVFCLTGQTKKCLLNTLDNQSNIQKRKRGRLSISQECLSDLDLELVLEPNMFSLL